MLSEYFFFLRKIEKISKISAVLLDVFLLIIYNQHVVFQIDHIMVYL